MPNWASVTYECVGDPNHIRLLHDALDINKEDGLWQDYGGNSVTTG